MALKYILPLVLLSSSVFAVDVDPILLKEEKKFRSLKKEDAEIHPQTFSLGFKQSYLQKFNQDAAAILKNDSRDELRLKDYQDKRSVLSDLEYEEGKVDALDEKVNAHLKEIEGKKYTHDTFAFLDYLSWQDNFRLTTPTGSKTLTTTNQGWCAGGGYGYSNSHYHFFADGCLVYARGDISGGSTGITYHQKNVYARGLKVSPGAGMFVSSVKAEVGVKIPFMYVTQDFSDPAVSGYHLKDSAKVKSLATIYTRYPFGQWFFQMEFGKMLDKDLTLWSLGGGYKF